jgi:hypothetical protein
MPAETKPTDRPDAALLTEVAEALDQTSTSHRAAASRAACAAAVLRSDAAAVGGEAARARLAHLALRMLAQPDAAFRPDGVARFLWHQHGYLQEAPLDLVRTVVGAEAGAPACGGGAPAGAARSGPGCRRGFSSLHQHDQHGNCARALVRCLPTRRAPRMAL